MKKLAIIGTAPSSINLAPYNDPDYELWGLNGVYSMVDFPNITNFTRWFDIHSLKCIREVYKTPQYSYGAGYVEWLQSLSIPVYMQEAYQEMPTAAKYPKEEILAMFPRRYFTNSISWMIALAIYEGYTDISLYGVDMATSSEYQDQRPSCEYFIGYCEGKGINFYLPEESDLLKTPFLYGFEDEKKDAFRVKLLARKQEMEQKKAQYQKQIEQATCFVNTYDGALQDIDYMLRAWITR